MTCKRENSAEKKSIVAGADANPAPVAKVPLTAKGGAPPQKRVALRSFFFSRAFATFLSLLAVHAFLAPLLLLLAIH
jgi:hypothetical protein